MLDFHLGIGGIDNPGEHLGGLASHEVVWLQKHGFLTEGKTGHHPDPIESIPCFDDSIFTNDQVQKIYFKFKNRLIEALKTPGFKSTATEKLDKILVTALEANEGLSTIAD